MLKTNEILFFQKNHKRLQKVHISRIFVCEKRKSQDLTFSFFTNKNAQNVFCKYVTATTKNRNKITTQGFGSSCRKNDSAYLDFTEDSKAVLEHTNAK